MKKVICMVIAIVATLSITGCQKKEEPKGDLAKMVSSITTGVYPLEYYREQRVDGWGFPYVTEGITFKGWGHL